MTLLLSERSQIFHRADPFAVSEYVNCHVGPHCIRLAPRGEPEASIRYRSFSRLGLCRISYGSSVQVTSPALESIYHLQILLKGRCRSQGAHGEQTYGPGDLLFINPDEPVDLTYSADCEKFIVKIPVSLLEEVCLAQHWTLPRQGIRFTAGGHGLDDINGFMPLLGLICQEAEHAATVEVQALYERIMATKLLGVLPSNVLRVAPAPKEQGGFEPLRQFIEAHLGEDIGIEQLMSVACVSERSLYLLFERQVGLSPCDYVRQRRLERVRSVLQSATARSVTEVALSHGFTHLGRFAGAYRKRFGELPSCTWQRASSAGARSGY